MSIWSSDSTEREYHHLFWITVSLRFLVLMHSAKWLYPITIIQFLISEITRTCLSVHSLEKTPTHFVAHANSCSRPGEHGKILAGSYNSLSHTDKNKHVFHLQLWDIFEFDRHAARFAHAQMQPTRYEKVAKYVVPEFRRLHRSNSAWFFSRWTSNKLCFTSSTSIPAGAPCMRIILALLTKGNAFAKMMTVVMRLMAGSA